MADIATFWDTAEGVGDWRIALGSYPILYDEDGAPLLSEVDLDLLSDNLDGVPARGLLGGRDLETAILISLFTDRQAGPDDVITDGSRDPRGWWGDLGQAYPIGSRLWLRMRAKQTDQTLQLVRGDIAEALQWMIDDGVVARLDIAAEWQAPGLLAASVTLNRTDGTTTALRYSWAWKDLG